MSIYVLCIFTMRVLSVSAICLTQHCALPKPEKWKARKRISDEDPIPHPLFYPSPPTLINPHSTQLMKLFYSLAQNIRKLDEEWNPPALVLQPHQKLRRWFRPGHGVQPFLSRLWILGPCSNKMRTPEAVVLNFFFPWTPLTIFANSCSSCSF